MFEKIYILLLYFSMLKYCETFLNVKETDIAVQLIKHLGISHGIIVSNSVNEPQNFETLKILSRRNVFAMACDWNGFNKADKNEKAVIVIKIEDVTDLNNFLQIYQSVFSNTMIWAIFMPKNYTEFIGSNNIHISYDSEFFAIYANDLENYEIAEWYQIKNETRILRKRYGSWSEKLGLSANTQVLLHRRKNFQGAPLILATETELPCSHKMECFQREIWDALSKMLNFTTVSISKAKLAKDHPGVIPDAEGKIKSLNLIRYEKSLVSPILFAKISMYIRKEFSSFQDWSSIFKPFDKKLWAAVLIWLIVTTLIILVIGYSQKVTSDKFQLADYLFVPLDTITSQEGSEITNKISHRIAALALRVTSIIILPAYSGAVVSFLTIQIPKIPFTDLYGFIKDGSYTIGSINRSYPVNFFLETKDPKLSIIREKYMIPLKHMPTSHEEAYRRLCTENFAFLGYNDNLDKLRHGPTKACKLVKIIPPFFSMPTGIVLAKDSPYKNVLYNRLVPLREAGIIKIMNKKLQSEDFKIIKEKKTELRPINLDAVKTTILIGLTGIVTSIFILTFEMLWCHWHHIGPDITQKFNALERKKI